jgi:agmatinase
MTVSVSPPPVHPRLWSGLCCDDPAAEVGVLGIPFDGATYFRKGAAFAPPRLRELSTRLSCSSEEGLPLALGVKDYGDLEPLLDWTGYFQEVEGRAADVLRHPLALFLGGDHSVTIPLTRAFGKSVGGSIGVLHFDAHPDLFDVYRGHRWGHACTGRRVLELPNLEPQHLVFVGLRSIAGPEWEFLQASPAIPRITARDWYRHGIDWVSEQVMKRLSGVEAVYITIDIDGLDASCAPGTGYPEAAGPTSRDLVELLRAVVGGLPVRALDVVEVSPPLDANDITSFAALKVIYEVFGVLQEKGG